MGLRLIRSVTSTISAVFKDRPSYTVEELLSQVASTEDQQAHSTQISTMSSTDIDSQALQQQQILTIQTTLKS